MRLIPSLAAFMMLSIAAGSARADSLPAGDPSASYISRFFQTTVDTARTAKTEESALADLSPLLDKGVALDEIARFILGRYWPADNPSEEQKFRDAFRGFVTKAFVRGVRAHSALNLSTRGSRRRDDGGFTVKSRLRLPTGVSVPLDWDLEKTETGEGFRITDVAIAGIDARIMLRNIATATLANGSGSLDSLITLFDKAVAPAVGDPATAP